MEKKYIYKYINQRVPVVCVCVCVFTKLFIKCVGFFFNCLLYKTPRLLLDVCPCSCPLHCIHQQLVERCEAAEVFGHHAHPDNQTALRELFLHTLNPCFPLRWCCIGQVWHHGNKGVLSAAGWQLPACLRSDNPGKTWNIIFYIVPFHSGNHARC